jgi:hypothetical protein
LWNWLIYSSGCKCLSILRSLAVWLVNNSSGEAAVEYLIGLFLSLAVAGLAAVIGLDRERAFYPTVLIVIASYNVLYCTDGSWAGTPH